MTRQIISPYVIVHTNYKIPSQKRIIDSSGLPCTRNATEVLLQLHQTREFMSCKKSNFRTRKTKMSKKTNFNLATINTKSEKRQPTKLLQIIATKENLVSPNGEEHTCVTFFKKQSCR